MRFICERVLWQILPPRWVCSPWSVDQPQSASSSLGHKLLVYGSAPVHKLNSLGSFLATMRTTAVTLLRRRLGLLRSSSAIRVWCTHRSTVVPPARPVRSFSSAAAIVADTNEETSNTAGVTQKDEQHEESQRRRLSEVGVVVSFVTVCLTQKHRVESRFSLLFQNDKMR